jgi:hypothetical protein
MEADGVIVAWEGDEKTGTQYRAPDRKEFGTALGKVMALIADGPSKTYSYQRYTTPTPTFTLSVQQDDSLYIQSIHSNE